MDGKGAWRSCADFVTRAERRGSPIRSLGWLLRRLPRTVAQLGVELVDEVGGRFGDVGARAEHGLGAGRVTAPGSRPAG